LRFTKEKEEKFSSQHEILEQNSKKIANSNIEQAYVIFPYNQKNLWIPDDKFWLEIKEGMMGNKGFLICSPNALVAARPKIDDSRYLITVNEMVLNYWQEIREYLENNLRIQSIIFISTDINLKRIWRDFNIVYGKEEGKIKVKEKVIVVPSSFWKTIYKIREAIVFNLPIWLYKLLGERR
jgi:hypothetical protein